MTETAPIPPPPQKGNGCLWSCLGLVAIILLPIIGVAGYGSWLVYHSITSDAGLRTVVKTLAGDGMTRQVLGDKVHVISVEGGALSGTAFSGEHALYILHLRGSRGDGTATVAADLSYSSIHVTSMILTGPDGTRYDIFHHTLTPPKNSI